MDSVKLRKTEKLIIRRPESKAFACWVLVSYRQLVSHASAAQSSSFIRLFARDSFYSTSNRLGYFSVTLTLKVKKRDDEKEWMDDDFLLYYSINEKSDIWNYKNELPKFFWYLLIQLLFGICRNMFVTLRHLEKRNQTLLMIVSSKNLEYIHIYNVDKAHTCLDKIRWFILRSQCFFLRFHQQNIENCFILRAILTMEYSKL